MVIDAMGHIVTGAMASFKEAVAEVETEAVTEDIPANRILPRTDVGGRPKPKEHVSEGPKEEIGEGPREELGALPIAPIAEEG